MNSDCDCYGAQSSNDQCCNTCNDVVRAYQLRDWSFKTNHFEQCRPGKYHNNLRSHKGITQR